MEATDRKYKPIGEGIQYFRKRAKLSQEDLARSLLVSRQTVSLWETGQTMPTIDNLIRLREIFGVSVDDILSGSYELGAKGLKAEQSHSEPDERYTFEFKSAEIKDMRRRAMLPSTVLCAVGAVLFLASLVAALTVRYAPYGIGILLGVMLSFGLAVTAVGGVGVRRGLRKCRKIWILAQSVYRYELYGDSTVVEVQQGDERYMEVIPLNGSAHLTEGGGFFTLVFCGRRYYIRSDDVPEDSSLRELVSGVK